MTTLFQILQLATLSILTALVPNSLSAQTLDSEIRRHLEEIRAYSSGKTDAIKSPKEMANALQDNIADLSRAVFLVDVSGSVNPSPERRALIERFASLIAPYNADLLQVGFSRDRALMDLAHQCRSLLDHTKPDEAFAAGLRSHLGDLTSDAWYAYDLLFQHRMLTPAEKSDLAQKVLVEPDREDRIRWAVKCSAMLMPEGGGVSL